MTSQTPRVKIGSVTDMGTVKRILPAGVQLEYRGQIFEASFAMIEQLVEQGKVS